MTAATLEVLDLSPVYPPRVVGKAPHGREVSFEDLVHSAGMKNVVSGSASSRILQIFGDRDIKVPRPGFPTFCLAVLDLGLSDHEMARETLRRLAYGFHDWAAREVVARYHRDVKRQVSTVKEADSAKEAGSVLDRIFRFIQDHPGVTVSEVAKSIGINQPNTSRGIAALERRGAIITNRDGRLTRCVPSFFPSNDISECSL